MTDDKGAGLSADSDDQRSGEASSGDPAVPVPGMVFGSYLLKKQIGEGSLARVFLAEHVSLKRRVALKILKAEAERKTNSVRRFFAEARTVNQIHHENIVSITDFVEGPPNYFVMEYLEGETLSRRLKRGGAIPVPEVLSILDQLGRALQAVHIKNIVHRDLKPANIFLTKTERAFPLVKLLDFGIAKLVDEVAAEAGVKTSAGVLLGTPEYMSPEQACAIPVDHRTDIYTLGLLAFEMLVGRRPCGKKIGVEALAFAQRGQIPAPSESSEMSPRHAVLLDDFVEGCCQKSPGERFQTMDDTLAALQGLAEEITGPKKRSNYFYVLVASVLVGLVLGLVFLFSPPSPQETAQVPATNTVSVSPPQIEKPAVPQMVQLEFETRPADVLVRRLADGKILGSTPLKVQLPSQSQTVEFVLEKEGFDSYPIQAVLDRSRSFSVQLVLNRPALVLPRTRPSKKKVKPLSKSKRSARKRKKPRKDRVKAVDKVETLNPFAND